MSIQDHRLCEIIIISNPSEDSAFRSDNRPRSAFLFSYQRKHHLPRAWLRYSCPSAVLPAPHRQPITSHNHLHAQGRGPLFSQKQEEHSHTNMTSACVSGVLAQADRPVRSGTLTYMSVPLLPDGLDNSDNADALFYWFSLVSIKFFGFH